MPHRLEIPVECFIKVQENGRKVVGNGAAGRRVSKLGRTPSNVSSEFTTMRFHTTVSRVPQSGRAT